MFQRVSSPTKSNTTNDKCSILTQAVHASAHGSVTPGSYSSTLCTSIVQVTEGGNTKTTCTSEFNTTYSPVATDVSLEHAANKNDNNAKFNNDNNAEFSRPKTPEFSDSSMDDNARLDATLHNLNSIHMDKKERAYSPILKELILSLTKFKYQYDPLPDNTAQKLKHLTKHVEPRFYPDIIAICNDNPWETSTNAGLSLDDVYCSIDGILLAHKYDRVDGKTRPKAESALTKEQKFQRLTEFENFRMIQADTLRMLHQAGLLTAHHVNQFRIIADQIRALIDMGKPSQLIEEHEKKSEAYMLDLVTMHAKFKHNIVISTKDLQGQSTDALLEYLHEQVLKIEKQLVDTVDGVEKEVISAASKNKLMHLIKQAKVNVAKLTKGPYKWPFWGAMVIIGLLAMFFLVPIIYAALAVGTVVTCCLMVASLYHQYKGKKIAPPTDL